MIWPFKRRPKSVLGIDIGTSVIRVVELARRGDQEMLKNYGFVSISPFYERPLRRIRKDTLLLSTREISEILKSILRTAEIKTQKAVFSLPDFASFFTSFTLPPMSKEEIPQAVQFEARRHVPLPLSEVTLDWSITKGIVSSPKKEELEILLVAVPNATIDQYKKIFELCKLELISLEAEVFGLQRSLIRDNEETIALIDIGAQSTTCTIVDKKILKYSHSFDVAGNDLTERLSKSLSLDYKAAEDLKKKRGILRDEQKTRDILTPLFDLMLVDIGKVTESFYQEEGKEIKTYIIAGGSAFLPGLKEYFSEHLKKAVKIANPFAKMLYPSILEGVLKEIGPEFPVAVGMALKGLE